MKVFYNAKILSPKKVFHWLVVSSDGLITEAGKGKPPIKGEMIDLNNSLILPGFHDAHIHLLDFGRSLKRLDLGKVNSLNELKRKLGEYVENKENMGKEWLFGFGWNHEKFSDKCMPQKEDLDEVVSDKPVFLLRTCHHIAVVNSKALEVLGIGSKLENMEEGVIDRINGKPTGILREDIMFSARDSIEQEETVEDRKELLKLAIKKCIEVGITNVQTNDPGAWRPYYELEKEDELKIRVHLTVGYNELDSPGCPEAQQVIGKLKAARVKLFADGSIGGSTAALEEPYSDNTGVGSEGKGVLLYKTEELLQMIKRAHNEGWRLEIHAIGDAGAHQVISCYESLELERPILTHCLVLNPNLMKRMKKAEIIANIQPISAVSDSLFAESRLGKRVENGYTYAWKTMSKFGIHLAGGSDAPVDIIDPLHGIYATMYRKGNPEQESWQESENMDFKKSLALFTTGAAYASITESAVGKLEVGYFADFCVLKEDVSTNHELLLTAKIREVYVQGNKV